MFKSHLVRFSFPKNIVTCNKGSEFEFKINFKDFYFESESDANSFTIEGLDYIDLSQAHSYSKSIWYRADEYHSWISVKKEVITV